MVSNKFLGALCVKLQLHKHLKLHSQIAMTHIAAYVFEITEALQESKGIRDYWTTTKNPPKVLPSSLMYHNLANSIPVPSRYCRSLSRCNLCGFRVQLRRSRALFQHEYRLVLRRHEYLRHFCQCPSCGKLAFFSKKKKKKRKKTSLLLLLILSQTHFHNLLTLSFGCTDYRIMSGPLPSYDGSPERTIAAVMIHDQIIADGQASSGKNAKLKAAKDALHQLQGIAPFEYRLQYRCDCVEKKEREDMEEGGGGRSSAENMGVDSAI